MQDPEKVKETVYLLNVLLDHYLRYSKGATGELILSSLTSQTLSVAQRRSLSVCGTLKAIGAADRKGSGLRD